MIVGTAGHIDHGKTTLVRALTGVDTDRLPEEKRRGISIELGYAFLPAGDGRIAFVDVPGHERLVATMLAGASGIDHALVLVAADDGPMPQTREHVAALALLGIRSATLVVTKADRADAARVAAVAVEAGALLAGTPLQGAPVFAVAASRGEGVDALRTHLVDLAAAASRAAGVAATADRAGGRAFRLAVDRVFSLAGAGTVATGTAHAGRVAVGDALAATPDGSGLGALRVRGVHAQNAAVEAAGAGQRIALQLAGVDAAALRRGGWLVEPGVALETTRLDVALAVWRDEARPLRTGTTVHLHVGADDVLATVHVLGGAEPGTSQRASAIAPGAAARVQLVAHRPVAAWRGDRVVLRDASATRMLAGGTVLDPFGPARHRAGPERLAELDALGAATPAARLAALLEAAPHGVDLDRFRRAEGLRALPARPDPTEAGAGDDAWAGALVDADFTVAVGRRAADAWRERIAAGLARFHAEHADALGPDAGRLRRAVAPRLGEAAWQRVVEAAVASGTVARREGLLHLPQQLERLSAVEERIAQKTLPRLLAGGFDPPWVRTLAADLREPEALLRAALLRLARRGDLHQVVKDLFYPTATLVRAAGLVRRLADGDGTLTAGAFRDATGLGRKRAIQLVEHFDRVGLLRRVGDTHRLRRDCGLFPDAGDSGHDGAGSGAVPPATAEGLPRPSRSAHGKSA